MGLDKYLRYGSSLEAYPWISNVTSDNDLGLNLCIVPTTCYTVIISESQEFSKKRFLVKVLVGLGWDLSQGSKKMSWVLVNFQTENYIVSTSLMCL